MNKRIESFVDIIKKLPNRLKKLPWIHVGIILICATLSMTVFYFTSSNNFMSLDTKSTLTNLLTVNGVFSAILITYLFSRITWSKERKLETLREAINLSQKVIEFRRILDKLTRYYHVWTSDAATKSLIDSHKFKNIDFYDYRLSSMSEYKPKNYELIEELKNHPDFREGISTLYLAMVSLVKNRNNLYSDPQTELYKDFEHKGLYSIKAVEKWRECGIFGSIWFWLDQNSNYINFSALTNDKEYIRAAAGRINEKYKESELNNSLIKELADDFESHYINELYLRLKELKKGVQNLNLLIIVLISISLFFGVLSPYALLLLQSENQWFSITVAILASINAGLISYFILRFPILINRELRWI